MAFISVAADQLPKRRQTIQRYFHGLSPIQHSQVYQRSLGSSVSFGLGPDPGPDLRAGRHRSRNGRVFLNYFEVWRVEDRGTMFTMEKAYLHLDIPLVNGVGDEEVLALHCDPALTRGAPAYAYKRGPHIHVSGNGRDISKSHIALCLTNLEPTCSDVNAFNSAFQTMIKML
jgi:hypothetical protein